MQENAILEVRPSDIDYSVLANVKFEDVQPGTILATLRKNNRIRVVATYVKLDESMANQFLVSSALIEESGILETDEVVDYLFYVDTKANTALLNDLSVAIPKLSADGVILSYDAVTRVDGRYSITYRPYDGFAIHDSETRSVISVFAIIDSFNKNVLGSEAIVLMSDGDTEEEIFYFFSVYGQLPAELWDLLVDKLMTAILGDIENTDVSYVAGTTSHSFDVSAAERGLSPHLVTVNSPDGKAETFPIALEYLAQYYH